MSENAGEMFKRYMKYLKTVWTLLYGAAFLFPLSIHFLKAIPVYGDEYLHTSLASLFSIFAVFLIYSFRIDIAYTSQKPKQLLSISLFILGSLTLFHYLDFIFKNIHYISEHMYEAYFNQTSLLFEYSLVFVFWTASFTLLAISEYMRANPKYILDYVRREGLIESISKMTPDTKNDMAKKLLKIIEEELENTEE